MVKRENEYKEKIKGLGGFTITTQSIKMLLTPSEFFVFDALIHFEQLHMPTVSFSLLKSNTNLTKMTIDKAKRNLVKMGFITITTQCTMKGMVYKIEWPTLYELFERVYNENNNVNKMIICDEYRTDKGLKSILSQNITDSKGTYLDVTINGQRKSKEAKTAGKTGGKKPSHNPEVDNIINQLNNLQEELKSEGLVEIEKNDLNNKITDLKNIIKRKNLLITYNQKTEKWEQMKH